MTEDERIIFEIEGSIDHIRGQLSALYRRRMNHPSHMERIKAARTVLNELQDAVTPLRSTQI